MKRMLVVLLLLCVAVAADAQRSSSSRQCVFNNDCMDPLICEGGYCRAQCATDRDCCSGWVCLRPAVTGAGPADGQSPGQGLNRCAAPGTPSNPVRWDASRNVWVPLPLPPPVVTVGGVAAVPAARDAGYAIPQGTSASPTHGHVVQTPVGAVNPGITVRRVHRAGGLEFQRGERDDFLYMRGEGGQWSTVGAGELTSEPSAVAAADGDVYVFGKGKDDAIWGVRCTRGSCGDWFSLGGTLTSAPTATIDAGGNVRVTAIGTDGRTWFVVQSGEKWSAWNPQ